MDPPSKRNFLVAVRVRPPDAATRHYGGAAGYHERRATASTGYYDDPHDVVRLSDGAALKGGFARSRSRSQSRAQAVAFWSAGNNAAQQAPSRGAHHESGGGDSRHRTASASQPADNGGPCNIVSVLVVKAGGAFAAAAAQPGLTSGNATRSGASGTSGGTSGFRRTNSAPTRFTAAAAVPGGRPPPAGPARKPVAARTTSAGASSRRAAGGVGVLSTLHQKQRSATGAGSGNSAATAEQKRGEISSLARVVGAASAADMTRDVARTVKLSFEFDYCFSGNRHHRAFADQVLIHRTIGSGAVTHVLNGFNCCILAYGQTGSGKTYTMLGGNEWDGAAATTSSSGGGGASPLYHGNSVNQTAFGNGGATNVGRYTRLGTSPHRGLIPRVCEELCARCGLAMISDAPQHQQQRHHENTRRLGAARDLFSGFNGAAASPTSESGEDGLAMSVRSEFFGAPSAAVNGYPPLADPNAVWNVSVSYYEIYNEKVRDLLAPPVIESGPGASAAAAGGLRVRERKDTGPYVEGLQEIPISGYLDALRLIDRGAKQRRVAATLQNRHSSRSHAVLRLQVRRATTTSAAAAAATADGRGDEFDMPPFDGNASPDATVPPIYPDEQQHQLQAQRRGGHHVKTVAMKRGGGRTTAATGAAAGAALTWTQSTCHLVDLAGSERLAPSDDMASARRAETTHINSSLSVLARVVNALTAAGGGSGGGASAAAHHHQHVPYRDSVITWLLRDSFGGNAKTIMVAAVSPEAKDVEETCSTLRYASRARLIENQPVVNVQVLSDDRDSVVAALRKEITDLRSRIAQYEHLAASFVQRPLGIGAVVAGHLSQAGALQASASVSSGGIPMVGGAVTARGGSTSTNNVIGASDTATALGAVSPIPGQRRLAPSALSAAGAVVHVDPTGAPSSPSAADGPTAPGEASARVRWAVATPDRMIPRRSVSVGASVGVMGTIVVTSPHGNYPVPPTPPRAEVVAPEQPRAPTASGGVVSGADPSVLGAAGVELILQMLRRGESRMDALERFIASSSVAYGDTKGPATRRINGTTANSPSSDAQSRARSGSANIDGVMTLAAASPAAAPPSGIRGALATPPPDAPIVGGRQNETAATALLEVTASDIDGQFSYNPISATPLLRGIADTPFPNGRRAPSFAHDRPMMPVRLGLSSAGTAAIIEAARAGDNAGATGDSGGPDSRGPSATTIGTADYSDETKQRPAHRVFGATSAAPSHHRATAVAAAPQDSDADASELLEPLAVSTFMVGAHPIRSSADAAHLDLSVTSSPLRGSSGGLAGALLPLAAVEKASNARGSATTLAVAEARSRHHQLQQKQQHFAATTAHPVSAAPVAAARDDDQVAPAAAKPRPHPQQQRRVQISKEAEEYALLASAIKPFRYPSHRLPTPTDEMEDLGLSGSEVLAASCNTTLAPSEASSVHRNRPQLQQHERYQQQHPFSLGSPRTPLMATTVHSNDTVATGSGFTRRGPHIESPMLQPPYSASENGGKMTPLTAMVKGLPGNSVVASSMSDQRRLAGVAINGVRTPMVYTNPNSADHVRSPAGPPSPTTALFAASSPIPAAQNYYNANLGSSGTGSTPVGAAGGGGDVAALLAQRQAALTARKQKIEEERARIHLAMAQRAAATTAQS